MAVDRKFKITQNDINKTFDQVKRSSEKKSFDQTPNLTENFDQLKMSSEIQSSDHSPSISDLPKPNFRTKPKVSKFWFV